MNKGKLNGKVAIVTGASKGIGAAIAKEFANEGATVVINYASAKEDADRIVDEITKRGGQAVAVQANVAKKADVERLFSAAKKAFGKIDILVNNAGVYDWSPIEEITEEQFHRMFDVNVLGLLLATQEAVKQFDSNGGNIINVSSTVVRRRRVRQFTPAPKARSTRSPERWPRNSAAQNSRQLHQSRSCRNRRRARGRFRPRRSSQKR